MRTLARILFVVALLALVVGGLARVRTDTTPASFLPAGDAAQRATTQAARAFGGDPIVVIAESSKPLTLLQPDQLVRLVALEGTVSRLDDVSVVYGPGTVLNQVAGQARNLLASISGRRDALQAVARKKALASGASSAEAAKVAARAVRRFDERYGALLVRGLPAGLPSLRNAGFVRAVALDENHDPKSQWRFVVPRQDAVAVIVRPREGLDQAATLRLVKAVDRAVDDAGLDTERVTVTGMPVVAAGLAGVLERELPLIGSAALFLIVGIYLLMPWLRRKRARLVPILTTCAATAATLALFGWLDHPLSIGAVAFLPVILGTGSDFPAYLVRGADRRVVVVCGLAAAAGFGSLALSPVPLVRDLGIALASGVVLTLLFGLMVTGRNASSSPPEAGDVPRAPGRLVSGRLRAVLLLAGAAAAVAGWVALPGVHIEADPNKLVAGAPEMTDAVHAEHVLGSSGEVQLLVRGADVTTPAALAWMTDVQDTVLRRYGDRLHPIASPPTLLGFLGPDPTPAQVQAGLAQVPAYLRTAVIRDDGREAVLSFGIDLDDVASQRRLLDGLTQALPTPPLGLTLTPAGLPVVAARSYGLLASHPYVGAAAGIAAAGLVLLIGLRRRRDALLAVGAAVLATGWGYLLAWSVGMALTPLTLAMGSLATATACEFTVLLGARHGWRGGLRRSVLVAAAAAAAGYLALSLSHLAVIRDFGLFLAGAVALSLLAAHTVRLLAPHHRSDPPSPRCGDRCDTEPKVEVLV